MKSKTRITLFTIALVAIIAVTGINVYSVMAGDDEEATVSINQMQEVIDANEQLESEVSRLENEQEMEEPAAMQERQEALQATAETFVQTVYTEEAESYDDRKDEAEPIMQDDLHDFLFPEDDQDETKHRAIPEDIQFFVESGELNQPEATIMARFTQTYSAGSEDDTTATFIELDAEQQDDGTWIIQDFRDAVESMEGDEGV
ncbi:hypothetical protein HUG15_02360 [Salicibibacter cibarius]|uniref:MerR family transcriptional regulator n=2 Tax=Salicibibacter TaxID=2685905 RepID=A0A514LJN2_9BACI|nr:MULTISPECIES: hypothetical protein [Salicibibacter]QDI92023.1 hypothetical protein EPH95_13240 [Salicibibacter halophilus]QQK74558.1 hypothetical protein HUG15_02360 [Salicibibacter cibarius]